MAAIEPEVALDWANELAAAIIADVHARRYTEAERLIAARLRTVKSDGILEGIDRLNGSLRKIRTAP